MIKLTCSKCKKIVNFDSPEDVTGHETLSGEWVCSIEHSTLEEKCKRNSTQPVLVLHWCEDCKKDNIQKRYCDTTRQLLKEERERNKK